MPTIYHRSGTAGAVSIGATITAKGTYSDATANQTLYTSSTDKTDGDNGISTQTVSTSSGAGAVVLQRILILYPQFTASTVIRSINGIWGVSSTGDTEPNIRMAWHIHAWITQGASNSVRGTLINNWVAPDADEWPFGASPVGYEIPLIECDEVIGQPGDILIIELATKFYNAFGAAVTAVGTKDGGGSPLSDLTVGGDGLSAAGWISYNLSEADVEPDVAPRFPPSVIVDDPKKPTQPWTPTDAGGGGDHGTTYTPTREDWCTPTPKDAIPFLELHAEKNPSSLGIDVIRHALTDESNESTYEGGYHEGRARAFTAIERGMSSPDGDHWLAQATLDFDDTDHYWRARKDVESTKYTSSRDALVKVYSPTARAAGTPASVRFRGKVREMPFTDGLGGSLVLEELIGSEYGPFYLDRPLQPRKFRREMFPDIDTELLDQIVPIIVGEVSDNERKTRDLIAADKGQCPGFFVGMRNIVRETGTTTPVTSSSKLAPPPAPTYTLVGVGGSTSWDYACVVRTKAGGKTTIGASVTIPNLPNEGSFTPANGVTLFLAQYSAELQSQVQGIDLYTRKTGTTRWYFMDAAGEMFTTGYNDDGDDSHFKPWNPVPTTNTATVSTTTIVDGVTLTTEVWGLIVFAGHACKGFVSGAGLYGSDVAEEGPARELWDITALVASGDILAPGEFGWPHANDYMDLTDANGVTERFFGIYVRGTRLEHHRLGQATIAANIRGIEDVGDGSGDLINQAFRQWKHILNAFVFANDGSGYYTGNWPADALFVDNTPAIRAEAVAAAEALGISILGTAQGFLGGFCLTEDITVRECLRRFNVTFTTWTWCTSEGQICVGLIDTTALPTAGTLFREDIDDVIRLSAPVERMDLIENRIEGKFDWDADAQAWASDREVIESPNSQTALGSDGRKSVRTRGLYEQFCTRDAATAAAARTQRLTLFQWPPVHVPLVTGFCGFEVEVNDQIRVSGHEGLGASGYQARPMLVMRHSDRLTDGEVDLSLWDLGPVLEQSFYGVIAGDEYQWGSISTNTTEWGSILTSTKRWG